jgi:hypothetical protein
MGLSSVWKGVTKAASGVGKIFSGDWTGFNDVYSGVNSLLTTTGKGDAFGRIETGAYRKPQVSLMQYRVGTTVPGSAQKIGQLGDTSMISDWSRNQAVAQYYLDHILRITKQGSPRKGG